MPTSLHLVYLATWLLLGLLADKFCERQAKKEDCPYDPKVMAACYIAGPVILPLAFLWAFGKALLHMLRH